MSFGNVTSLLCGVLFGTLLHRLLMSLLQKKSCKKSLGHFDTKKLNKKNSLSFLSCFSSTGFLPVALILNFKLFNGVREG